MAKTSSRDGTPPASSPRGWWVCTRQPFVAQVKHEVFSPRFRETLKASFWSRTWDRDGISGIAASTRDRLSPLSRSTYKCASNRPLLHCGMAKDWVTGDSRAPKPKFKAGGIENSHRICVEHLRKRTSPHPLVINLFTRASPCFIFVAALRQSTIGCLDSETSNTQTIPTESTPRWGVTVSCQPIRF